MLLYLIVLAIVGVVWLIKKKYSYWDNTNIPHLKTELPFGAIKPLIQQKRSFGLIIYDIYKESKEKVLGFYILFKPTLLVRDAKLSRQLMTSDFASFHDRGLYVDEKHDPLSANLFTLPGQSWRTLRAKLTPSFSSGKLKGMFDTIDDVGTKMIDHLNDEVGDSKDGKVFEMKNLMTTYAVDIIGSVIFGLEIDSFSNPNNDFRKLSTDALNNQSILGQIFNSASFICPAVAKFMTRLGYVEPIVLNMRNIIKRTIDFREDHKVYRKDLLQLLIQLRNTGKISEDDDKIWDVETVAENLKAMSIDSLGANGFLFYIAGSETTAATASFTLYELSMYPELLRKAQKEVLDVLEQHGLKPSDKFTYEAMQSMKFLELCIMETTRKYPGLPFLNRECTQDFPIPDTDITIKKGTPIIISLFGMHRDAEYFPDPELYSPERFAEETKNYDPVAYMPFGEGPRHCIAQRMGVMNSKLAVAKVLANFNLELRERQEVEFIFETAPVLLPKNGLNVRLSKRI